MTKATNVLALGLISVVASSQAMAATSISCTNNPTKSRLEAKITFQAKVISNTELANVVMTVVPKDQTTFKSAMGQGHLSADLKYHPRKYLNTNRFTTNALRDASGHAFLPMDQCVFEILLPNTIANWSSGGGVPSPMLVHCDQSGGLEPLFCRVQ